MAVRGPDAEGSNVTWNVVLPPGTTGELGASVKTVVGRLRTVSSGVSRLVREMGTEGKLGGQASVEGLSGTWKHLVDDVNLLAGNLTVVLLFLQNAVFRGSGDAAIAMRVLMFGNALNIILGPCFIFGLGPFPQLGVTGASVATNIGRGSAVLFQVVTLARGRGRVQLALRHLRLDLGTMRTVLRLSGTGTFQILIGTASYIGLVRILSVFGSAALAGYTIGIRVIIFALLPAFGISNAAATMVGQNLGAGQPDRAERAVWTAARYNVVFLGGIGLVFIVLAQPIVGIFTTDVLAQPFAVACLRIVSLGFLFYAYGMVLTQSFNGAGDTWTPTFINVFIFWVMEIPLAWALAYRTSLGARGVPAALAIAYSALAVVSAIVFRQGRWKRTKI